MEETSKRVITIGLIVYLKLKRERRKIRKNVITKAVEITKPKFVSKGYTFITFTKNV